MSDSQLDDSQHVKITDSTEVNILNVDSDGRIGVNNFGGDGTGITQPTGGSGILGWLSGIYDTLKKTLVQVAATTWAMRTTEYNPYYGWEFTSSDIYLSISPGQQVESEWQPHVVCENLLIHGNDVVEQLDSSNNLIGQTIRMSLDNIYEISVVLSGSAQSTLIDDFSSYANSSELQSTWVSSDAVKTSNTLDSGGNPSNCMKIITSGNQSLNDKVTKTYSTNQNWSNFSAIVFDIKQSIVGTSLEFKVRIIDLAGNSSSSVIPITSANVWESKSISISSLVVDGSNPVDLTTIKKVEFECLKSVASSYALVDNIKWVSDIGNVNFKIASLGSSQAPSSINTFVSDDNGSTIYNISGIETVPKIFRIPFKKGVKSVGAITIGEYIAFTLSGHASGSIIKLHGSTSGNKYASGKSFTSIDNGESITYHENSDATFIVRSVPDTAIMVRIIGDMDKISNNSTIKMMLHNGVTDKIDIALVDNFRMLNRTTHDSDFSKLIAIKPFKFDKPNSKHHLVLTWEQDSFGEATVGNVHFQYIFPPVTRYN